MKPQERIKDIEIGKTRWYTLTGIYLLALEDVKEIVKKYEEDFEEGYKFDNLLKELEVEK